VYAQFLLVARLALTPQMEAVWSSETSINFYQTTWRHMPEDGSLQGVWSPSNKNSVRRSDKTGDTILSREGVSDSSG
jgi:hypothetical protein